MAYDDPDENELEQIRDELSVALKGLRMRSDARADLIDLLQRVVEYMNFHADAIDPIPIPPEAARIQTDAKELLTRSWDDRYDPD